MDNLIASLEKLIAKKKAIKQGTVQELLTGKKRLPGFSGEWKPQTIGDLATVKDGTHGTYVRKKEGYLLLSAKNVFNGKLCISDESYISSDDYSEITNNGFPQREDILLSCVGTIGRCCIYTGKPKAAFQRSVAFLRCHAINNTFLLYLIQAENVQKQLLQSANVSAQGGVYLSAITEIELLYPEDRNEQAIIASILLDMDAEIEQLEKKLAKYRLVKLGMMQELLTGRIRLVQPSNKLDTEAGEAKAVPVRGNQHYDDAVAISAIVNAFYNENYSLGRVKIQKLLYLLRRKQDADLSSFKKKTAGPYNEEARYKGGESIAIKSKYIVRESSNKRFQI